MNERVWDVYGTMDTLAQNEIHPPNNIHSMDNVYNIKDTRIFVILHDDDNDDDDDLAITTARLKVPGYNTHRFKL